MSLLEHSHPSNKVSDQSVIFSGPDLRPDVLCNQLESSIASTPQGGTIHWVSYYLINQKILGSLIEAFNRNVHLALLFEKTPRTNLGLSTFDMLPTSTYSAVSKKIWWNIFGIKWKPHFHEKIYYFSHPSPHVYVGSYNPSDDVTNSQEFVNEVGDHSISHNVLVKITQPEVVTFIHDHCKNMHRWIYRTLSRYWPDRTRSFSGNHYQVLLWPRLRNPLHKITRQLKPGDQIRAAVSHLKGPGVLGFFEKAKRKGAKVELLLDSTERRVPKKMLAKLNRLGIHYMQLQLPANCLMHNKFMLIDQEKHRSVIFGSLNWSTRSQWLNHEIAVRTDEEEIVRAFEKRWTELIGK